MIWLNIPASISLTNLLLSLFYNMYYSSSLKELFIFLSQCKRSSTQNKEKFFECAGLLCNWLNWKANSSVF